MEVEDRNADSIDIFAVCGHLMLSESFTVMSDGHVKSLGGLEASGVERKRHFDRGTFVLVTKKRRRNVSYFIDCFLGERGDLDS